MRDGSDLRKKKDKIHGEKKGCGGGLLQSSGVPAWKEKMENALKTPRIKKGNHININGGGGCKVKKGEKGGSGGGAIMGQQRCKPRQLPDVEGEKTARKLGQKRKKKKMNQGGGGRKKLGK